MCFTCVSCHTCVWILACLFRPCPELSSLSMHCIIKPSCLLCLVRFPLCWFEHWIFQEDFRFWIFGFLFVFWTLGICWVNTFWVKKSAFGSSPPVLPANHDTNHAQTTITAKRNAGQTSLLGDMLNTMIKKDSFTRAAWCLTFRSMIVSVADDADNCHRCHDVQAWHKNLGHCNYTDALRLESITEGMEIKGKSETSNLQCEVCTQGKFIQKRATGEKHKLHLNLYTWT